MMKSMEFEPVTYVSSTRVETPGAHHNCEVLKHVTYVNATPCTKGFFIDLMVYYKRVG